MPELKDTLDSTQDPVQESPRPGHRRTKFIAIVLLGILAAAGGWFWLGRKSDAAASPPDASPVKSTLHLDSFVLNLADSDARAYLRVGIDLGLRREPERGESPAPLAQVRDTILGVLADSKADELMTGAGKVRLKERLVRALNERVPELGVEEVYFTEFLIQR